MFNKWTKKEDIDRLHEDINAKLDRFYKEMRNKEEELLREISLFNSYITLINGMRNDDIGPIMKKIKSFLGKIGDVRSEFSVFDFELESQQIFTDNYSDIEFETKKIENKLNLSENNWLIGSPIKLIADRISNGKKVVLATKDIAELEVRMSHEKQSIQQKINKLNEDIEIAKLYTFTMKAIIENINEKIIPELEMVIAFLMAEKVKNDVLVSSEELSISLEPIELLAHSLHHRHYVFVQNTFLYYILIQNFFEKLVITKLVSNENTTNYKDVVKDQINLLEDQYNKIEKNLSY